MRIGLVVDSGCDLPRSYLDKHGIVVLPVTIRIDQDHLIDNHEPQPAQDFYRFNLGNRGHDTESVAFSSEQIHSLFLERVVTDFDYVFCQTVMRSRSPLFENVRQAAFAILSDYKNVRSRAGIDGPFNLRVIDSKTMFAGQGALAAATIDLIESGLSPHDIRVRLDRLSRHSYAYGVAPDLHHVRQRSKQRGGQAVSWLSATMGSAMDIKPIFCAHDNQTFPVGKARGFESAAKQIFAHGCKEIRKGLISRSICLSFAGELEDLAQFPGYPELLRTAAEHQVELLTSVMSLTGGVNLGRGALSLGMISTSQQFN